MFWRKDANSSKKSFCFWKVEIFRIIKIAFRIQICRRNVCFSCFGYVWHKRIVCCYKHFFLLFENFGRYIKLKDEHESQLKLLGSKFLFKYLLPLFIVFMIKISSAELFQAPFTTSKQVKSLYLLCFFCKFYEKLWEKWNFMKWSLLIKVYFYQRAISMKPRKLAMEGTLSEIFAIKTSRYDFCFVSLM